MEDEECSLGFIKMPEGYKLMRESYDGLYYWQTTCDEQYYSWPHWNKWKIYYSAKDHKCKKHLKELKNG